MVFFDCALKYFSSTSVFQESDRDLEKRGVKGAVEGAAKVSRSRLFSMVVP